MVNLDSPEPRELAGFYARLLGREPTEDTPDWVVLPASDGGVGLAFQREEAFVRPVWPAGPSDQQMMMHLEIEVDDLAEAESHAQACGATRADFQPQDDVRVYLDPDGHPFCLYLGD